MAIINGTNLRDIINGTSLADTIFGNGGNDRLLGQGGNDAIRGGSGSDIIEGGAGNDVLFADSNEGGEDVLFGGADSDILVSGTGATTSTAARDRRRELAGVVLRRQREPATGRATSARRRGHLHQIENLIGSRFNDTLRGDNAGNELFGGEGNDTLRGEGGNDHLSGGAGNDVLDGGAGVNNLRGGAGVDTADYSAASSAGHPWTCSTTTRPRRPDRRPERDRGGPRLTFADDIVGDEFGNRLEGMAGDDTIDGGEGNDMLTGGAGADTFVFFARDAGQASPGEVNSGFDRILDFDRAEGDRIDLRATWRRPTFADLRADASQFGTDTHLRLGVDTIVLEDVALAELSANMFLF